MQDLIDYVERKHMKDKTSDCRVGDTVRVMVRVGEGTEESGPRYQAFEGVVIGRKGGGINESIRVRRVTRGVGIERVFPLHAPAVGDIEIIRHGRINRAQAYYLRQRIGRKARVRAENRERMMARGIEPEPEAEEQIDEAEHVIEGVDEPAEEQQPAPEADELAEQPEQAEDATEPQQDDADEHEADKADEDDAENED